MNLKSIGWLQAGRGLREGNQGVLLAGLGLVLLQRLRDSKPKRELVYRKKLPVGSTLVVRHTRRGEPRVRVLPPIDESASD